jgi:addiction module RelB/DinJ family antitoxin
MAKTSSLYIRIDPQVKADVEQIYAKFGMSITDAINVFLYQSRNIGGLPFDLRPATSLGIVPTSSVKGALEKYSNPELKEKEKAAWSNAVKEKFGSEDGFLTP